MTQVKTIPLSVPHIFGREWKYVKECLDTGWVSSAGPFVEGIEKKICQLTHASFAVATTSGTAALHVALEVAGVCQKDEVIVPTVTFIAPINSVRYVGAEPIFMDCDEYYNIDVQKTLHFLEEETVMKNGFCFNPKTGKKISAIIPVHVFGNAVNLASLIPACRKRKIKIIEDATESLGTVYRTGRLAGKHTGTIGDLGCFSFNGNKIVTAGGGGMIITDDIEYAKTAKYLTTQAKDDSLYFIHHSVGYNFRLNNIQAAMGMAQLEQLAKVIRQKKKNYAEYKKSLDRIPGLSLGKVPSYADNNHWMYPLRVNEKKYGVSRDELLRLFQKEQIEVRPLWHLNHLQRPYQHCQSYKIEKANELIAETVNLPCSYGLEKAQLAKVIRLLKSWKK